MCRSAAVLLQASIIACSFFFPLVAAEAYFRVRYPRTEMLEGHHRPDPEIGWDTAPSVIPLRNAARERQILFLGDSFVDGKQWPSIAQKEAASRGAPFDGFVLGVSGHGTTQQFLKLQREISRYRPDAVVLLFFAWNDLRDNIRTPSVFYSPSLITRPYYVPADGGFVLRNDPPSSFANLLSKSEVFIRIVQRIALRVNAARAREDIHRFAREGIARALYYDELVAWRPFYDSREQKGEYVALAYNTTEHVLREMKRFLDTRGIAFVVLGMDNAFTVDADVFERHIHDAENVDVALPTERMEQITRDLGIPFVSLLAPLRVERQKLGRKIYNGPLGNIGAHLEPEGERILGEAAAREILRALR